MAPNPSPSLAKIIPQSILIENMKRCKNYTSAPHGEVSWNLLIVGLVRQGKFEDALNMYHKLQEANFQPNEYAAAALLRVCSELKKFQTCFKIHTEVIMNGLMELDVFVGNTLIHTYVKLGSLKEAETVFNSLPAQDIVSWNILLSGFIKHDCGEEALSLFEVMRCKNVSPNNVTFITILKACGLLQALREGQQIHALVARSRLAERDMAVGNALLDMYIKCDSLSLAREVFCNLVLRDVVSWNELMVGFIRYEHAQNVLDAFEQMQLEALCPDAVTFVCALKAAGLVGAPCQGAKIHARIAMKGSPECDHVVINAIVDMYSTCGYFEQAKQLFEKYLVSDVISWTSLMAGYAKHNDNMDALFCFDQMQTEGVFPNSVTLVCALKACGSAGVIHKGQEIHAKVSMLQLSDGNTYLGNSLVDMYAKCGMLERAQDVFDRLFCRDTASWNTLIAGYAQKERCKEAFACFEKMSLAGVPLDAVSLVCGLKACSGTRNLEEGRNLEFEIYRKGLLLDVIIGNALISFHLKCGSYTRAQETFERLLKPDITSWTTIMGYHINQDKGEDALLCFTEMQAREIYPDAHAFVCSLKACSIMRALERGKEIHAEIESSGLLEENLFICSALVDMYFKCGWTAGAQKLFDRLPARDVVTWTALLAGYADHSCSVEAMMSFKKMDADGALPDVVAFTRGLEACGITGAIEKGRDMHVEIAEKGMLEIPQPILGNALVAMYAKWGFFEYAEEVLHTMVVRDINSWNALISGYAHQGDIENAIHVLQSMITEGERPNLATFVYVLNACGHAGFVNKGKIVFERMSQEHGITPNLKHCLCMIDLLNRAGHLDLSAAAIINLPSRRNPAIWQSALNACLQFSHVDLGKMAFVNALQVNSSQSTSVNQQN